MSTDLNATHAFLSKELIIIKSQIKDAIIQRDSILGELVPVRNEVDKRKEEIRGEIDEFSRSLSLIKTDHNIWEKKVNDITILFNKIVSQIDALRKEEYCLIDYIQSLNRHIFSLQNRCIELENAINNYSDILIATERAKKEKQEAEYGIISIRTEKEEFELEKQLFQREKDFFKIEKENIRKTQEAVAKDWEFIVSQKKILVEREENIRRMELARMGRADKSNLKIFAEKINGIP